LPFEIAYKPWTHKLTVSTALWQAVGSFTDLTDSHIEILQQNSVDFMFCDRH
jgi:hypothetical protein